MSGKIVRFNEALVFLVERIKRRKDILHGDVVVVRDLYGKFSLLLGEKPQGNNILLAALKRELCEGLGQYFEGKQLITHKEDLFASDSFFNSPDGDIVHDDGALRITVLDRMVVGHDWLRAPIATSSTTERIAFYGIKGGVGRSTALSLWAWRLACAGKKVLVFDFDLESPGVSSTLLPVGRTPTYGVVDWFVESALGQADDAFCRDMVASSPLADGQPGEIFVVPAMGSGTGPYLPKLARAYLGIQEGQRGVSWPERLERLVELHENMWRPDVVFLDSRAGLHDLAAVVVTRLKAQVLLFAVNSTQTWVAYKALFEYWSSRQALAEAIGPKLQMVASLVPETGADDYLDDFIQNAYNIFSEYLYVETGADDLSSFSFSVGDGEAPHTPWRINWNRALMEFDPLSKPDVFSDHVVLAAMGDFFKSADTLVRAEED